MKLSGTALAKALGASKVRVSQLATPQCRRSARKVRINSARPRRGSNTFAYSSYRALLDPTIYGFKRSSSGTLTALNILPSMPQGSPNNEGYCPFKAAPDTTNHVAIPVWALDNHVWQLAVYTADASGNLTTNSTSSNMPKVSVGVNDVSASPSGKHLAVDKVPTRS